MTNSPVSSENSSPLREAMVRRLLRRGEARGEIIIPAVPGMLDEYVQMCSKVFATVGSPFTPEQLDHLRSALESQLVAAYQATQRSDIIITWHTPVGSVLNYHIQPRAKTIAETYDDWIATRQPPLFGTQPDARVWDLANEAANPRQFSILDIGAGTGRNAVALARRGHPVDVVEVNEKFVDMIRKEASRERLRVGLIQRDVFATSTEDLDDDYDLIILSEVVPEFRTTEQLRTLFQLADDCLAPGGRMVFNAFMAAHNYTPDEAVIQLGEQMYTRIFTYPEMAAAAEGLPLEQVSDDSVFDYEKANLPEGGWPPTGWYPEWVSGLDVFALPRELCPIDMRWLVYRKQA
ncbi:bifunctional 2-polyprenyl-6-hydroxyphenol methylase/3-demethylubiquinol 3-O-methyltransferase UbiG [Mycolicibacterium sp. F2034L]|uniref:class I SAM-dependent methyltransferase n=1 Tax=Mycolicibacterium sp. F2034L TaxID=2926422 RepID=UPI001FF2106E|nr:class I SAM-dependent methyltransferase [Mycolicibacterium sp. F2034L]MCK0173074.1 class I SAM-dependent methyltransferase [Mycolicibacterium sp. F2034L]